MKIESRHVIVYLLLGMTALFIHTHENINVPVNKSFAGFPVKLKEWSMVTQTSFDPNVLAMLKPTDYLYRVYKDTKGDMVSLYLGYHSGGPDSGPIHSPKNCLPGSGWYRVSEEVKTLKVKEKELSMVSAVYQKEGPGELFYYWFQVQGKTLTNVYALKIAEIINSIFHNRKDSAFIRVSVRFDRNSQQPFLLVEKFIHDFYLEIDAVFPK